MKLARIKTLSLLVISLAAAVTAHSVTLDTNEKVKDAGMAYGFVTGQNVSLEQVATKYASLAQEARLARWLFDLQFKQAADALKDALEKTLGPTGWHKFDTELKAKQKEMAKTPFTQDEARQFIASVHQRTQCKAMMANVCRTLLNAHPSYRKYPHKEFTQRFTETFKHDGSGKAKGLAFNIQYPMSWVVKEAKRPNIAFKAVSDTTDMFMVTIRNTDEPLTPKDWEDAMNLETDQGVVGEGARILEFGRYTIESQPGMWITSEQTMQRGRHELSMFATHFLTSYQDKFIVLQGMVPAGEDKTKGKERFKQLETLFDLMANSFVLPQMY